MSELLSRIGILDLVPRDKDSNLDDPYENSEELIKYADEMGIRRYWFAEYHHTPAVFSTNPYMLVTYFGSLTQRIRLGVCAMFTDKENVATTAEQVRIMQALFPNRIDAGFINCCENELSMKYCHMHKATSKMHAHFSEDLRHTQMNDLTDVLNNRLPIDAQHPDKVLIPEQIGSQVNVFVMVSTSEYVDYIAKNGWGLVFGLFINDDLKEAERAIRRYKELFRPSIFMTRPCAIVALYVVSARDKALIPLLAKGLAYWHTSLKNARYTTLRLPDLEEIEDMALTDEEEQTLTSLKETQAIGTKEVVGRQLRSMRRYLKCDEFLVINQLATHNYRKELIEILSQINLEV